VLAAWNGLMIRGMAIAARVLGDPALADIRRTGAGVRAPRARGRRPADGDLEGRPRAPFPAYLDDYAFLLDAALEMLQLRWSRADLEFAVALADACWRVSRTPGAAASCSPPRPRAAAGAAAAPGRRCPAGRQRHRGAGAQPARLPAGRAALPGGRGTRRALGAARCAAAPFAHCTLLDALEEQLDPPEIVIVRGTPKRAGEWARTARLVYAPRRLVFEIPPIAG
jgi:uncharacterized protein